MNEYFLVSVENNGRKTSIDRNMRFDRPQPTKALETSGLKVAKSQESITLLLIGAHPHCWAVHQCVPVVRL